MIVNPDDLRPGDVVTMRDTFKVTEVTDTEIWDGEVAYSKTSMTPSVTRVWDLFAVQR
jgi:hypothetical protein